MKFIKKIFFKIIIGFLQIYVYNIIYKSDYLFLPINIFTLGLTSKFGIYGLLALIVIRLFM